MEATHLGDRGKLGRPNGLAARLGLVTVLGALALSGCTTLGAAGPSSGRVARADGKAFAASNIVLVNLDSATTRRLQAVDALPLFSDALGNVGPTSTVVGPGDQLDVTIIEAPPAVLFSSSVGETSPRTAAGVSVVSPMSASKGWSAPQQVIDRDGRIFIPFAGTVPAVGRTPREIERDITARLTGKAHEPQVVVRRVGNANADVTVLGDVPQSGRYPLSARGERLLDIVASAGGPKQSIRETVVQVSRNGHTYVMPLARVTGDAAQNVTLQPDDVVTVIRQPFTFTSLGANGKNAEIPFDGPGYTLAQALGQMGGLVDNRSNVKGVFVFRFEKPDALDPARTASLPVMPDGRVPVIYRVDLNDPSSLFLVQNFPVRNRDVVYVSSAPLSDFNKFLGVLSQTIFAVVGVVTTVP